MANLTTQEQAEYIRLIHEAASELRDFTLALTNTNYPHAKKMLENARYIRFACAKLNPITDYVE